MTWRPIYTLKMPRAGYFMVCGMDNVAGLDDYEGQCAVVWVDDDGKFVADETPDGKTIPIWFKPTHWMPVPAPPFPA